MYVLFCVLVIAIHKLREKLVGIGASDALFFLLFAGRAFV
jgi:hypothetical protein